MRIETYFVAPPFKLIDKTKGYAKELSVLFLEVLDSVTEPFAFNRSTRRIRLGVPPDQHILTSSVAQLDLSTILVQQAESGGCFTNPYHLPFSFSDAMNVTFRM